MSSALRPLQALANGANRTWFVAGADPQLARKGWDGCVKGSHIPSAHLRGTSSSFHLTDVTVEDCDDASGRMTLRYASVSEAPSKPSTR